MGGDRFRVIRRLVGVFPGHDQVINQQTGLFSIDHTSRCAFQDVVDIDQVQTEHLLALVFDETIETAELQRTALDDVKEILKGSKSTTAKTSRRRPAAEEE